MKKKITKKVLRKKIARQKGNSKQKTTEMLLDDIECNVIKKMLLTTPYTEEYLSFVKKQFRNMIEEWSDDERVYISNRLKIINEHLDSIVKFLFGKHLQRQLRN